LFLMASLALTSFLGGYILVGHEVKANAKQKTGTLLDRFEERVVDSTKEISTQQRPSLPEITTRMFLNLSPNISIYAISPDNKKIAYFIPPKKGREGGVFVSNLDGSNQKSVFKTRVVNLSISWTKEDEVIIEIDQLKKPVILKRSND